MLFDQYLFLCHLHTELLQAVCFSLPPAAKMVSGVLLKGLLYYYANVAFVLVACFFLNIAWYIPVVKNLVVVWFNRVTRMEMPISEYWDTLFSWKMLKVYFKILHRHYVDRTALAGETAPNPPLVSVDGKQRCRLLDLAKESRPLILNFGNYT